ncbi:NifU family protein [Zavarzinia sp.]|uniref:NifU family protein n=1 Tax=Zavarzinia sp. TaxID=2027920 RepID=UPI003563A3AC
MNAEAPTPRADLAGYVGDIQRLEAVVATWAPAQAGTVNALRIAVEALHAEAFRRLVRALKVEPAALGALKAALGDEVIYAVLRRLGVVKASLTERVQAALDEVRPALASHGGDVELVTVRPPAIEVRFLGACDHCPASALTFHEGVKKAVQAACPEITEVIQARGSGTCDEGLRFVSPFAADAVGHWRPACTLAEIPEGGVHGTTLDGEKILLSRRGDTVTCFQNACAHLGLALDGGEVADGIVTCPYHGFQYDLASGECLTAPEVQLLAHGVRVIGDRVEVRLAR